MSTGVQWSGWFTVRQLWIGLLVLLLGSGASITALAQEADARDYTRITQVPRAEVDAWLKQEVKASGGDWDHDRYHLYIGFSTGHFGQDPVHGIAMRRLAFSLMNNSLAVGDRVTPFAWELTTWDVGPTVTLTDDPATRTEFVNRVPYGPRSNSKGGHDIERTLYETITKVVPADETGSAIVLLLTNSNASQTPTGEKADLFGADNPRLISALRKGSYRLPLVRKEFRLQAGSQPVTVAVTALFPEKLVSIPGAPTGPRYPTFARDTWQPSTDKPANAERLPNPVVARPAPPATGSPAAERPRAGLPGWFWPLIVVIAIAVVAALVLRGRASKPLEAADTQKKKVAVGPQGTPIPGSLTVTIGPAAESLEPLTTASLWTVQRDAAGAVTVVPAPAPGVAPAPTAEPNSAAATVPLAAMSFDAKRVLRVEAKSGAQFIELQGTAAGQSDSRVLLLDPGRRLLCRILPPDTTTKTRFEIVYEVQKGSRV